MSYIDQFTPLASFKGVNYYGRENREKEIFGEICEAMLYSWTTFYGNEVQATGAEHISLRPASFDSVTALSGFLKLIQLAFTRDSSESAQGRIRK